MSDVGDDVGSSRARQQEARRTPSDDTACSSRLIPVPPSDDLLSTTELPLGCETLLGAAAVLVVQPISESGIGADRFEQPVDPVFRPVVNGEV